MKSIKLFAILAGLTIALCMAGTSAWADVPPNCDVTPGGSPNVHTTSCISFESNPVTVGDTKTVTATATYNDTGAPVNVGELRIERAAVYQISTNSFLHYSSCNPTLDTDQEVRFDIFDSEGTPGGPDGDDTDGELTANADTSVAGTFGYRAHLISGGATRPSDGGNVLDSKSPCLDLVVNDAPCTGVTIAADFAGGDGAPTPGTTDTWKFRIRVHACEDATNVSAQGGDNGWTTSAVDSTDPPNPSLGTVAVRKANKKTTVWLWTIGDMSAGDEATLLMDVTGSIKAGTSECGKIKTLNGPWSALYSTDFGATIQKSSYTGQITITVTCP